MNSKITTTQTLPAEKVRQVLTSLASQLDHMNPGRTATAITNLIKGDLPGGEISAIQFKDILRNLVRSERPYEALIPGYRELTEDFAATDKHLNRLRDKLTHSKSEIDSMLTNITAIEKISGPNAKLAASTAHLLSMKRMLEKEEHAIAQGEELVRQERESFSARYKLQKLLIDGSVNLILGSVIQDLSEGKPNWAITLGGISELRSDSSGAKQATEPTLSVLDPQMTGKYIASVHSMAHKIFDILKQHGHIDSQETLTVVPSFGYGTIAPTGAIGIALESHIVELWTPFGRIVCGKQFRGTIPPEAREEIISTFNAKAVDKPFTLFSFGGVEHYVATNDAKGNILPTDHRPLEAALDRNILQPLWDKNIPANVPTLNEAHLIGDSGLFRRQFGEPGKHREALYSDDKDKRVAAVEALSQLKIEELPHIQRAFCVETDDRAKLDMMGSIARFGKSAIVDERFRRELARWISAKVRDDSDPRAEGIGYNAIRIARDSFGPIESAVMVPALMESIRKWPGGQWNIQYLGQFGAEATPALPQLNVIASTNNGWPGYYAKEAIDTITNA